MRSSFSRTWFCEVLSPVEQPEDHMFECGVVLDVPWVPLRGLSPEGLCLSHEMWYRAQSPITGGSCVEWRELSYPVCIIPTCCVTCRIQLPKRTEGWMGISELLRDILHETFQNKTTNCSSICLK